MELKIKYQKLKSNIIKKMNEQQTLQELAINLINSRFSSARNTIVMKI